MIEINNFLLDVLCIKGYTFSTVISGGGKKNTIISETVKEVVHKNKCIDQDTIIKRGKCIHDYIFNALQSRKTIVLKRNDPTLSSFISL